MVALKRHECLIKLFYITQSYKSALCVTVSVHVTVALHYLLLQKNISQPVTKLAKSAINQAGPKSLQANYI